MYPAAEIGLSPPVASVKPEKPLGITQRLNVLTDKLKLAAAIVGRIKNLAATYGQVVLPELQEATNLQSALPPVDDLKGQLKKEAGSDGETNQPIESETQNQPRGINQEPVLIRPSQIPTIRSATKKGEDFGTTYRTPEIDGIHEIVIEETYALEGIMITSERLLEGRWFTLEKEAETYIRSHLDEIKTVYKTDQEQELNRLALKIERNSTFKVIDKKRTTERLLVDLDSVNADTLMSLPESYWKKDDTSVKLFLPRSLMHALYTYLDTSEVPQTIKQQFKNHYFHDILKNYVSGEYNLDYVLGSVYTANDQLSESGVRQLAENYVRDYFTNYNHADAIKSMERHERRHFHDNVEDNYLYDLVRAEFKKAKKLTEAHPISPKVNRFFTSMRVLEETQAMLYETITSLPQYGPMNEAVAQFAQVPLTYNRSALIWRMSHIPRSFAVQPSTDTFVPQHSDIELIADWLDGQDTINPSDKLEYRLAPLSILYFRDIFTDPHHPDLSKMLVTTNLNSNAAFAQETFKRLQHFQADPEKYIKENITPERLLALDTYLKQTRHELHDSLIQTVPKSG